MFKTLNVTLPCNGIIQFKSQFSQCAAAVNTNSPKFWHTMGAGLLQKVECNQMVQIEEKSIEYIAYMIDSQR
jgi:hypothetical protein